MNRGVISNIRQNLFRAFIALELVLLSTANAQFADDHRMWNEFMLREQQGNRWSTHTWAELRWVEDVSRLGSWFLQQKLYYKVRPGFQLGGGAAWIEVQNANGAWNTLARAEFELNPSWALGNKTKLSLRNRLETRWWENRNWETEFVSRHRLLYSHKADWIGSMTRYEMSNELFFDYSEGRFNENRFRPLNIFFKLTDISTVNYFVQIRSRLLGNDYNWSHAYILGSGIRW